MSAGDGHALISWASNVWGTLAMGNYPYPSSYLMHGQSLLPAWPVREACKGLDREFNLNLGGELEASLFLTFNNLKCRERFTLTLIGGIF